mgnify:CR=1 FL=1
MYRSIISIIIITIIININNYFFVVLYVPSVNFLLIWKESGWTISIRCYLWPWNHISYFSRAILLLVINRHSLITDNDQKTLMMLTNLNKISLWKTTANIIFLFWCKTIPMVKLENLMLTRRFNRHIHQTISEWFACRTRACAFDM